MQLSIEERAVHWASLQSETYRKLRLSQEGAWQIKGAKEGAHIWIVGSVHGNEAVGAVVIKNLLDLALKEELIEQGTLTLVLGNPKAFLADQRYIDQDLNRAFSLFDTQDEHQPNQEEQEQSIEADSQEVMSYELKRKTEIEQLLQANPPQFILDLHSVSRGNHGIIVYPEGAESWAESLCCLETHFCYSKTHMAGETLIDAGFALGAGVMVVECGHHHSPNTIQVALAHIQKLLHHFKLSTRVLVEILPEYTNRITRYRSIKMIKPNLGFHFLKAVETGSFVKAGEVFAKDQDGEHRADIDSWFMMPSLEVKAHDQDAGWLCIRELIFHS